MVQKAPCISGGSAALYISLYSKQSHISAATPPSPVLKAISLVNVHTIVCALASCSGGVVPAERSLRSGARGASERQATTATDALKREACRVMSASEVSLIGLETSLYP